jgi:hypothetical protein
MEEYNLARKKFNLDKSELDGYSILVHGGRASGKTHLTGDFLRTESAFGPVRFINVAGEDGQLTLRGMGLGEVGETIESYADFADAMKEYQEKLKLQALGIDSIHALSRWIMRKVTGSDRLPEIRKESNEWGELHHTSYNTFMSVRRAAKLVMCTCPSDKSVEQLSGKTFITPDLPGRQAAGSAGWFDFVGYIEATPTPSGINRTFNMTPNALTIVRQRLPKQITEPVKLPIGQGGWQAIKDAIEKGWKD